MVRNHMDVMFDGAPGELAVTGYVAQGTPDGRHPYSVLRFTMTEAIQQTWFTLSAEDLRAASVAFADHAAELETALKPRAVPAEEDDTDEDH